VGPFFAADYLFNEVISAVEHIETFPEIATVVEYNVRGKCLRASHARCRSIWPTYPPVTLVYSSCTRAAGRKPGLETCGGHGALRRSTCGTLGCEKVLSLLRIPSTLGRSSAILFKKNSWLNPRWRADVNPVTGYPFHNFGTSMGTLPSRNGERADCHRRGWSFAYLSIRVFFPTRLNVTVSFTSSPTRSRFSMIPSPN
jgi:hypothetical protein